MVSQGGVTITVDDEQVKRMLGDIARRGSDLKPALSAVGALIKESIRTNFAQGGRPSPWKKIKNRQGQPLRDTGRLMNSITRQVTGSEVRVGTNVIYAAVHHFGAKRGSFGTKMATVKQHSRTMHMVFGRRLKTPKSVTVGTHQRKMALPWGDIPARPFMMVQDDDLIDIIDILTRYLTEGTL